MKVLFKEGLMVKRSDILPGVGYMLLAGFVMSIQGVGIRLLKGNASIEFMIFVRFIICLFLSVFVQLFVRWDLKKWSIHNRKLLLIRSIVAYLALVICYWGLANYNAGLVFVFFFSTPLFIPFIARFWPGVPIIPRLFIGLIIALIGIVCVINPFQEELQHGLIYVLFGAIFGAISMVGVRVLHRTDSTKMITLSYFLIGTIGALVALFLSGKPLMQEYTKLSVFLLIVIGIMAYLFQLFFTQSLKYAPSRLLSPFTYSSSIYSLFINALFFGLVPSFVSLMGVFLVIIGTIINVFLFPSES